MFDHPGLRVTAASPEHMLAMKVLAGRPRDAGDLRFLVERLRLVSAAEVFALCAEVFPAEPVPDRAKQLIEEIFLTQADRGGETPGAEGQA
ncbi:MAG TPA: hypothetical protein VMU51_23875 [Mycobacteriales bacterium]|nr:hypothetical protein [Mycobacteriales bacterium]